MVRVKGFAKPALAACVLFIAACGAVDGNGRGPDDVDGGGIAGDGGSSSREAGAEEDAGPLLPWEMIIDPGKIHQIKITLDNMADWVQLETLRADDVPAELVFDDMVFKSVGVHQKGSDTSGCRCLRLPCKNPMCVTSYVDKVKPGLKIKFDAFISGQRLLGLKKVVLNNAHQDLSFLSADIVYELYRRAGLYAPRTSFAQVVINGIPLGLYNVEENTDSQMMAQNFGDGSGNLYEGTAEIDFVTNPDGPGVGARMNAALDLDDEVKDMRSRDDLVQASNTILGASNAEFFTKVSTVVDLDRFITMWALDSVTPSRDSYVFHLNNYALYDNPKDKKIVFLPHGADCSLMNCSVMNGPIEMAAVGPDTLAYPTPRGVYENLQGADGMLAMAVRDIPSLYTRYEAAVKKITSPGSNPLIWDPNDAGWMMKRIAQLDMLLATQAKPDARMTADIAQFKKFRPVIEKFIKEYGTAKRPVKMGVPLPAPAANRVPVIVSTDLFYIPTAGTMDDFVDMAVLMSMPELDVKGVVLDNVLPGQDRAQLARPGSIALAQLQTLTRQRVPAYVGLNKALASASDKVMDDEARFQGATAFIIDTLKKTTADHSVTIVTLGSLRDVAAAFNRETALFKQKVGKLLVFAGEAAANPGNTANLREYNATLDPFAFAAIMKSGLPIYWVPRQDGGKAGMHPNNNGHASTWTAPMANLLDPLIGMQCAPLTECPPLGYLLNLFSTMTAPPKQPTYQIVWVLYYPTYTIPETQQILDKKAMLTQDLWASAALAAAADKTVTYDGTNPPALATGLLQPPAGAVFGFTDVSVTVSDTGAVMSYGAGAKVKRFDRLAPDQATYARAMSLMTGQMLARLIVPAPPAKP